jgi:transcriptional regulator with XRE-family HTH domain
VAVTPSEGTLGDRLRRQRVAQGLSLRELARRLAVSPSLVSQIETGKTQPSVRTLYAIVNELGGSFDDVFGVDADGGAARPKPAEPVDAGRVQRLDDRRVIDLETGVRWERLTPRDEPGVEFLLAVYPPGSESSPSNALVRHNGREFGLILKGELRLTVGFEDHVLGPGDSIVFESTTPHRLRNDGDEPVEAVWVVLGRSPGEAVTPMFTLP